MCYTTQVVEDLTIARLRAERGIDKVRVQFDVFAIGAILATKHHIARHEQAVVVAILDIREGHKAIQIVERTTTGLGHQATRKLRNRIAPIEVQAVQIDPI